MVDGERESASGPTSKDADMKEGAAVEQHAGRGAKQNRTPTSTYRGVCWHRKSRRWQSAINSSGRHVYLGSFDTEEEAARMFDKVAIRVRGPKAKINFPYEDYLGPDGQLLSDPRVESLAAEARRATLEKQRWMEAQHDDAADESHSPLAAAAEGNKRRRLTHEALAPIGTTTGFAPKLQPAAAGRTAAAGCGRASDGGAAGGGVVAGRFPQHGGPGAIGYDTGSWRSGPGRRPTGGGGPGEAAALQLQLGLRRGWPAGQDWTSGYEAPAVGPLAQAQIQALLAAQGGALDGLGGGPPGNLRKALGADGVGVGVGVVGARGGGSGGDGDDALASAAVAAGPAREDRPKSLEGLVLARLQEGEAQARLLAQLGGLLAGCGPAAQGRPEGRSATSDGSADRPADHSEAALKLLLQHHHLRDPNAASDARPLPLARPPSPPPPPRPPPQQQQQQHHHHQQLPSTTTTSSVDTQLQLLLLQTAMLSNGPAGSGPAPGGRSAPGALDLAAPDQRDAAAAGPSSQGELSRLASLLTRLRQGAGEAGSGDGLATDTTSRLGVMGGGRPVGAGGGGGGGRAWDDGGADPTSRAVAALQLLRQPQELPQPQTNTAVPATRRVTELSAPRVVELRQDLTRTAGDSIAAIIGGGGGGGGGGAALGRPAVPAADRGAGDSPHLETQAAARAGAGAGAGATSAAGEGASQPLPQTLITRFLATVGQHLPPGAGVELVIPSSDPSLLGYTYAPGAPAPQAAGSGSGGASQRLSTQAASALAGAGAGAGRASTDGTPGATATAAGAGVYYRGQHRNLGSYSSMADATQACRSCMGMLLDVTASLQEEARALAALGAGGGGRQAAADAAPAVAGLQGGREARVQLEAEGAPGLQPRGRAAAASLSAWGLDLGQQGPAGAPPLRAADDVTPGVQQLQLQQQQQQRVSALPSFGGFSLDLRGVASAVHLQQPSRDPFGAPLPAAAAAAAAGPEGQQPGEPRRQLSGASVAGRPDSDDEAGAGADRGRARGAAGTGQRGPLPGGGGRCRTSSDAGSGDGGRSRDDDDDRDGRGPEDEAQRSRLVAQLLAVLQLQQQKQQQQEQLQQGQGQHTQQSQGSWDQQLLSRQSLNRQEGGGGPAARPRERAGGEWAQAARQLQNEVGGDTAAAPLDPLASLLEALRQQQEQQEPLQLGRRQRLCGPPGQEPHGGGLLLSGPPSVSCPPARPMTSPTAASANAATPALQDPPPLRLSPPLHTSQQRQGEEPCGAAAREQMSGSAQVDLWVLQRLLLLHQAQQQQQQQAQDLCRHTLLPCSSAEQQPSQHHQQQLHQQQVASLLPLLQKQQQQQQQGCGLPAIQREHSGASEGAAETTGSSLEEAVTVVMGEAHAAL